MKFIKTNKESSAKVLGVMVLVLGVLYVNWFVYNDTVNWLSNEMVAVIQEDNSLKE